MRAAAVPAQVTSGVTLGQWKVQQARLIQTVVCPPAARACCLTRLCGAARGQPGEHRCLVRVLRYEPREALDACCPVQAPGTAGQGGGTACQPEAHVWLLPFSAGRVLCCPLPQSMRPCRPKSCTRVSAPIPHAPHALGRGCSRMLWTASAEQGSTACRGRAGRLGVGPEAAAGRCDCAAGGRAVRCGRHALLQGAHEETRFRIEGSGKACPHSLRSSMAACRAVHAARSPELWGAWTTW